MVTGIASMTNMSRVGRVTGKAMLYFLTFSSLALVVGMIVANIIQPGKGLNIDPATLVNDKVNSYVERLMLQISLTFHEYYSANISESACWW